MPIKALSFILAIVPSLLLIRFFYKRDLNPEPRGLLIKTFFAGFVSVILLFPLASILIFPGLSGIDFRIRSLYVAFCVAAIPEELLKFGVLTLLSMRARAFDEPMDGIVYGAVASLGFATIENLLYVSFGGMGTALIRMFSSVPAHACFGAIMGYYAGRSRFEQSKFLLWFGLFFAILLHGLYDYGIFLSGGGVVIDGISPRQASIYILGGYLLFVVIMLFQVIFVLTRVQKLRREQLAARAEKDRRN